MRNGHDTFIADVDVSGPVMSPVLIVVTQRNYYGKERRWRGDNVEDLIIPSRQKEEGCTNAFRKLVRMQALNSDSKRLSVLLLPLQQKSTLYPSTSGTPI